MIQARCKICGGEVNVEEPEGFAAYCVASSAARNQRISAELSLREQRKWKHDARPSRQVNAMGCIAKPELPELQRSTPDDVRKAWISTLCHESCYERRDKRRALEDRIEVAVLHKVNHPSEWVEGSRLRKALADICREWCRLVARDLGSSTGVFWEEFVQALLEFPKERGQVMSSARDFIKSQIKLRQQELIQG